MKYKLPSDAIDFRDFQYVPTLTMLAPTVDLRQWASPVETQGELGSCASNTIVGSYELLLNHQFPDRYIDLSRLFVYFNSRLIEESVFMDAGATMRDTIKVMKLYGLCSENMWPYNIDYFTVAPSIDSYADAKTRNIKDYFRISDLGGILDALNNNYPISIGMLVYSTFDDLTPQNIILEMPLTYESPLGGHAVCLVGYDLPNRLILARNSYGPEWGDLGYFWITFDYLEAQLMDAWVFNIELSYRDEPSAI